MGDAAAAAALLQRSLEIDPNGSFAKVGAAIQAAQAGRINEARKLYKDAVAADPANPANLRALALFYEEYGSQHDEAIIASRKALALDPLNSQIANSLITPYAHLGDVDQAVYWLDRYNQTSLAPDKTHPLIQNIKNPEGQLQRALDRLENNQQRQGLDLWLLLKHDIATGQPEKSLARYQVTYPQFFVEDPVVTGQNFANAKDAAWALFACGFREQGLKLIDRAIRVIESMEVKRKPLSFRAQMYAVAELEPEAIAAINDLFNGGGSVISVLSRDEFNSLKDNPEFQAIAAREEAKLQAQRDRIEAMEAAGELAPIPPLPEKQEAKP
jgi:tetratricopeptide (TPR) repeat protein